MNNFLKRAFSPVSNLIRRITTTRDNQEESTVTEKAIHEFRKCINRYGKFNMATPTGRLYVKAMLRDNMLKTGVPEELAEEIHQKISHIMDTIDSPEAAEECEKLANGKGTTEERQKYHLTSDIHSATHTDKTKALLDFCKNWYASDLQNEKNIFDEVKERAPELYQKYVEEIQVLFGDHFDSLIEDNSKLLSFERSVLQAIAQKDPTAALFLAGTKISSTPNDLDFGKEWEDGASPASEEEKTMAMAHVTLEKIRESVEQKSTQLSTEIDTTVKSVHL